MSSLHTLHEHGSGDAEAFLAPRAAPREFAAPPRRARPAADLARVIEGEIIPRLMLAHTPSAPPDPAPAPHPVASVGPRTLEAFARMALSSEAATLAAYVETLVEGGLSLEEIYVDLLIPTARRLSDDWNADAISFADVALGLSRLQQVVRALGHAPDACDSEAPARAAYFTPASKERGAFGLILLEDGFRRAGWRTWLDTTATGEAAERALRHAWFDVFGMNAARDASVEAVAGAIAQARRASCNPDLFVMVGGRLFADRPELAARVGADAVSGMASEALRIAERAVGPRASC